MEQSHIASHMKFREGKSSKHFQECLLRCELVSDDYKSNASNVPIELLTASPVSPASSTSTVVFVSSERRDARTSPPTPPPKMTKSYDDLSWDEVIMLADT